MSTQRSVLEDVAKCKNSWMFGANRKYVISIHSVRTCANLGLVNMERKKRGTKIWKTGRGLRLPLRDRKQRSDHLPVNMMQCHSSIRTFSLAELLMANR